MVERFAGRARKEIPWDRIDPMREGRFALEGTLEDRIFQKEFNAGMKEIRPTYHCIRELGWRPPDDSDAYEVTFALRLESNAAGGVQIVDAEIKQASLSDAALEECMLDRLRGAAFETGPVYDARLRLDFLEVVDF